MKPLRVAFFTECYHPIVNGIVASVDALAAQLRARGHEVFFFAPSVPGFDEIENAAVFRIPSLPLPTSTQYRLTLPFALGRHGTRVLETIDLVHTHSPFVTGWMGAHFAHRYGKPLVFTYHTQLEHYAHYVPFDASATRRFVTHLTKTYANGTDAVIVPTSAMEQRLRDMGVAVRIAAIASGIDVARFARAARSEAARALLGAPAGATAYLIVSRLGKEKNVGLALEALARAGPSAFLTIVGDGPERANLEAQAALLRVAERVRFLGAMAPDALPAIYAAADAFVFPSVSETQGLVLAEALAAGLTVIAVDTPQTREVVGEAGIVCDATAQSLAVAMGVAGMTRSHERRLGAQARAEHFSAAAQAERVLELYADVLATRAREHRTATV